MLKCGACGKESNPGASYCSVCGAPVQPESPLETLTAIPVARAAEEGRFAPGTVLAGRYRIVSLLGRGGMGEVYRATDSRLEQQVALKFLPANTANHSGVLQRFHKEVKLARQVSHANVCRVYDIGEHGDQVFLSMEYVDGEDLQSLLKRIGRLPEDKAVEIARRICAGLAAAHEKGILHRDLKPANVMLDKRGQVVLMDFGLAAVADDVAGPGAKVERLNGTPAYMAPEQLMGTEVTVRSDVYAIGLLLYEMLTGKRAFEGRTRAELIERRKQSDLSSLASLVKGLDATLERLVMQCLEFDAARRPGSALAVAAALPGGDPLAAALAAGATPSPEMVAAARETSAMGWPAALACLALVFAGMAALAVVCTKNGFPQRIRFEFAPEAMALKGRELARRLGFTDTPRDSAYGYEYSRIPGVPVRFWYRESPSPIMLDSVHGLWNQLPLSLSDPPPVKIGMRGMWLDPAGRLVHFEAIPRGDEPPSSAADWKLLFDYAGLDAKEWTATDPTAVPLAPVDERAAWTGTIAGAPVRIEAARWRGRPVYFDLAGSAGRGDPEATDFTLFWILLIISAVIARHNLRLGRGDWRGGLKLCFVVVLLEHITGLISQPHYGPVWSELALQQDLLGIHLLKSSSLLLGYLALEPYVRKRWPKSLISWSRLLAGRLTDPLVGRDLLLGCAFGTVAALILNAAHWLHELATGLPATAVVPQTLLGARCALYSINFSVILGLWVGIAAVFLLLLTNMLLRRTWLAISATGIIGAVTAAGGPAPWVGYLLGLVLWTLDGVVFLRTGLLALVAGISTQMTLASLPLTTDLSTPYAGSSVLAIGVIGGLALYGLRTAMAGRPLLRDEILDR